MEIKYIRKKNTYRKEIYKEQESGIKYKDGTYIDRKYIRKIEMGTNTKMRYIQKEEIYRVKTYIKLGSRDIYGDGTYTKKRLIESGNTHRVGE